MLGDARCTTAGLQSRERAVLPISVLSRSELGTWKGLGSPHLFRTLCDMAFEAKCNKS